MTSATREQIVNSIQDQMPYLAAEYGVSRIGLFGSFAADKADEKSDIDLLVEFHFPIGFRYMELVDFLEALLGREVDVLTPLSVILPDEYYRYASEAAPFSFPGEENCEYLGVAQ